MNNINDEILNKFRNSGSFDEEWYVEQYPDVKILGMDPAEHYIWIGAKLGRRATKEGDHYNVPHPELGGGISPNGGNDYKKEMGSRWIGNTAAIAKNPVVPSAALYKTFNPKSLNIHWVVQDFSIGSGGHMSIFRMVHWLEQFGHKQTLWLQNASRHESEEAALKQIRRHFQPLNKVVLRFLDNDVEGISGDVIIATDMWTPFPVVNMPLFKERFYFVQDYEACFHSIGTYSHLADYTYQFGLKVVCAGKWLRRLMTDKFNLWARDWELAYDSNNYYKPTIKPIASFLNGKPRIAFYARQATSRRMVEFGKVAFDILYERGIDFHVEFFGQDDIDIKAQYSYKNHGVMSPSQLGHLYRNCDIGVVFSATNYSLIPMEMMACGLPVVELDTESTREVFPLDAVQFAEPSPVAIADAIELLLTNPERRKVVRQGGQKFISTLSWEKSARALESALLEGLSETCSPVIPSEVVENYREYPFKASIIIPTWNAGDHFRQVLQAVLDQKVDWPFEVLVLDSGSTDGTIDFVKSKAGDGVRLHEIPNDQFQHGRTRNLAASLTSGEFIAVLTQDALPADERWLRNLIKAFDASPLIAGVFGGHRAYPDASPYLTKDIHDHFEWHNAMPNVMDWYSDPVERPFGRLQWAQWLHFFSDNNAAIRRSVWESIPYPEINWGEDQVWAWEIIKQGYKKAYAHDSVVIHSHNYNYDEKFKINKVEARFFLKYFSYSYERTSKEVCDCIRGINARDYRLGRVNVWSEQEIYARMIDNEASVRGHFAGRIAHLEELGIDKFYSITGPLPEPFVKNDWERAKKLISSANCPTEGLPEHFDPLFYLMFNPDLLLFNCDPYEHYITFGKKENRIFN